MARIVLILVVCTILMFIVVLQTPPQFVRAALSGYVTFLDESPKDPEEEEKKPAAERARKARTTVTSPTRRSAPVPSKSEVAVNTSQAQPEAPPSSTPEQAGPYVFCVAADGTALYSLNSTDGAVVGVLRKGDIVEPQLEVNDAGQTWAFVSVAGQKMSGFLQKDSLERQRLRQAIQ
jgi:hypothetical protein